MGTVDYAEKFSNLTDEELRYELLRCANDSYLLRSPEEQTAAHYKERHSAVWAELRKRGLVHKATVERR